MRFVERFDAGVLFADVPIERWRLNRRDARRTEAVLAGMPTRARARVERGCHGRAELARAFLPPGGARATWVSPRG